MRTAEKMGDKSWQRRQVYVRPFRHRDKQQCSALIYNDRRQEKCTMHPNHPNVVYIEHQYTLFDESGTARVGRYQNSGML